MAVYLCDLPLKTHTCVSAKSLQSCLTLGNPMDCSHQVLLSMGCSRQEYWSGLPCPPLGDLPNPGIGPTSIRSPVLAAGFLTTSTTWEAAHTTHTHTHTQPQFNHGKSYQTNLSEGAFYKPFDQYS